MTALDVLCLAPRGDVDGDDVVDRALAGSPGTRGVSCPADINGDRRVDATDLRGLSRILR